MRTCWRCGSFIEAADSAFEVERSKGSISKPERLIRLCGSCWQHIEIVLEQVGYRMRLAAGKNICWKCSCAIKPGSLRFSIRRFGRSYNPPEKLLWLCDSCWKPINNALKSAGYRVRSAHTVDYPHHARSGAVVIGSIEDREVAS